MRRNFDSHLCLCEQADVVKKQMDFLRIVVEDEDYFTGLRLQRALNTGMKEFVNFGLNEGGGRKNSISHEKITADI